MIQNDNRQREQLHASGTIDRIFEDKISGRTRALRLGLTECMTYLRDGDELVVSSIDRLTRSLTDLRALVDELTDKGVTVTFLHEHLSFSKGNSDPRADLMLGILGSFAEFVHAIIPEARPKLSPWRKGRQLHRPQARPDTRASRRRAEAYRGGGAESIGGSRLRDCQPRPLLSTRR